jgi:hypothetical protein
MPLTDSIYNYNLIHGQYGLKLRRGYRAWITGLGAAVRTMLSYVLPDGTQELWVITPDGIYDGSSSTSSPAIDTAFGVTTGLAGWASWTNFTTIATQYIALCDEENGYYTYNGTIWANIVAGGGGGQISGSDPDDFVFVLAWKQKLFFVEKNSTSAWHLPVGQITGTVTEFNFGTKFKHGGYLIGLYNWTMDGGEGIDDYLVAISSGGDVLLYKGTDPSSAATFALHGQWNVGTFPAGRRVVFPLEGDLLLITGNGVVPLSELAAGSSLSNLRQSRTHKISPVVSSLLKSTIEDRGWEINLLPQDDILMIATPKRIGYPDFQFVQSIQSEGWAYYRNLPYTTGATYNGELYFGDSTGKVYVHFGDLDNVAIDGSTFEYVEFSVLWAFQNFNMPTRYKRVQFIRPIFLSGGMPAYEIKAVYDYNLNEISAGTGTPSGGAQWDIAQWDNAVWSGAISKLEAVRGGEGMGRKVAIALRGHSTSKLTLIEAEVMFDVGGHL